MAILFLTDSALAQIHPGLLLLYGGLISFILYYVSTAIYLIFFHPLAKFPGPKFAAFSRLPFVLSLVKGTFTTDIQELHERYGEVVRFSPNHLSFTNGEAWKEIYNYRSGIPHFTKDKKNYFTPINGVDNIHSTSDDATHSRQRRLLSHAFSEKALREQEPLIKSYIDLLMKRLHEEVQGPSKGKVDLVRWLNWTSFDLIGDLTFGEPFYCLQSTDYHPWIAIIFDWMRAAVFTVATKQFPLLDNLLARLIPKQVLQKFHDHSNLSAEKMDRRLAMKTERPDFVTYLVERSGEAGINIDEMHSNSTLLILAGSETTATALSGTVFHLCKNPDKLQKLVKEIRSAIKSADDLTFKNLAELKYLHAVLEESMRIYPPVAGYLPRVAPKEGAFVGGHLVPPGTQVAVTPWAITHSSSNFRNPDSFVPERWLDDSNGIYASDKREASQPFSVGPRNCIGKNLAWAEMRLILSEFLWNFDVEVCEESRNWLDQKTYILWEKSPLILQLTPRKTA